MYYPKIPDYYLIRLQQYPVKHALPWPDTSADMDAMIPDVDDKGLCRIDLTEAILTALAFYKAGASTEEAMRIYYLKDVYSFDITDFDHYLLDFENLQEPILPAIKLLPDGAWLGDKITVILKPDSGLITNSNCEKVKVSSFCTELYGVTHNTIITEDYPKIPLEYISRIECDLEEAYKERVIRSLCG